jgi:GTP-binding protein EngB required for normal cell division
MLDKRQTDLDKEVEFIKKRADEIRAIKEKADKLEEDRLKALEKVANLSAEDAKKEIIAISSRSRTSRIS